MSPSSTKTGSSKMHQSPKRKNPRLGHSFAPTRCPRLQAGIFFSRMFDSTGARSMWLWATIQFYVEISSSILVYLVDTLHIAPLIWSLWAVTPNRRSVNCMLWLPTKSIQFNMETLPKNSFVINIPHWELCTSPALCKCNRNSTTSIQTLH